MARDFYQVVAKITDELSPELVDQLNKSIVLWAPYIYWKNLSEWVRSYVKPDSSDPRSIKIYGVLYDIPEEEVLFLFKNNNF